MSDEWPDISKFRVVDLKDLCIQLGLETKGKKADLQNRLHAHFEANSKEDAPSEEAGQEIETPQAEAEETPEVEVPTQKQEEEIAEEPVKERVNEPEPIQEIEKAAEPEPANEPEPAHEPEPASESEPVNEPESATEQQQVDDSEPTSEPIAESNNESDDKNKAPELVEEKMEEEPIQKTSEEPPPLTEPEEITEDSPPPLQHAPEEAMETEEKEEKPIEEEKMEVEEPKKKDEEREKRRRERKSRWTEQSQVVIGQQVTSAKEGPAPVPRTKEDGTKLTKAQRKKLKKKRRKDEKRKEGDSGVDTGNDSADQKDKSDKLNVEIDYIADDPELDPVTLQFSKVFDAFRAAQIVDNEMNQDSRKGPIKQHGDGVDLMAGDPDSEEEDKKGENENKISKKKLKKQSRLTVAELKQIVERPDLVEMHDVTSMDPKLLVLLKSTRNSVAVPRHWSYKRKYLSGKRGIEKPPFELPEFIRKTGIMEMREALQQKESEQGMKAKMRQRVRPKLGKIDIDYQKLHDAFFRYQTKPKMSRHGDIYYEGKEYETRLRELKPGELTDDLRTSLGMPLGNNASKVPPPWLIAMQRYGPPPSYPNLKIPGLNAPIPSGCSFGYHAGGWGKPPVDERGRPLYGDVFGVENPVGQYEDEKPSEQLWGELDSDEESSSDDESEDESEDEGDQDGTGVPTLAEPSSAVPDGLETPSGTQSQVPDPIQAPAEIELRKSQPTQKSTVDMSNPPPLYQVLQEKSVSVGKGMMGTSHVYDLKGKKSDQPGTEISINPEDLELDPAAIAAKYQHRSQSGKEKEDMSDMMAEHLNKTSRDRKRKNQAKDDPKSKKYKDFKF